MSRHTLTLTTPYVLEAERYELRADGLYRFDPDRRAFVQVLGASLVIAASAATASAQPNGGRRRRGDEQSRTESLDQRFHIGADGVVTVFTSKVEVGQGSRTQLTQAAAEELRLPADRIRLVMADTALCPDDGGTAGSRTTPANVPQIRRAAAAAREILLALAAQRLQVDPSQLDCREGLFADRSSGKQLTLAELAQNDALKSLLQDAASGEASLADADQWKVLGTSVPQVNARDLVTGAARFPSDVSRPGMLYGKVLRAPTYNATLQSLEIPADPALSGVTIVRDNSFVGVAAGNSWLAAAAIDALAAAAKWDNPPHPSSDELFTHLKKTASHDGDAWPRPRVDAWGDGAQALDSVPPERRLAADYTVAYIQHAPLEPRAAVAQWNDGQLTVWTGSQQPSRVHSELSAAFQLPADRVRVIVPDTGGSFGGKHTGEVAVEAARLAKAAGKPVSLRWSREEEFTWAYCRPAGLIEVRAALDDAGRIAAWDFTNYNSGESGIRLPYDAPHGRTQFLAADSPLRQGSYRALASTANNFARESAIDELAAMAAADPLAFRLAHLADGRLKDVLTAVAEKFTWTERYARRAADRGVGLACGTEKGSFVAACVEVEVQPGGAPRVTTVCQAFECGAIQNPANLRRQVEGAIIMGLGGALTEQMVFKDGRLATASFSKYAVPRMADVPQLDIVLLNRPDLPSVGAGETPIIAVAPAIANALANATGRRIRSMPLIPGGS
ncbi:MAG: xanthine dehydrogenase family protein molybdopterin-binding subunit [Pirellulales bacterium]|nr:xanthine dehydrogenase family protein molybdopterin-binding subunit [Pirellulales bacterium]